MPRMHEIKCLTKYFDETVAGRKRFELRNDDRGYEVGDFLAMNEHDGQKYTGRAMLLRIDFIMNPNDVMTCAGGFVLMGVHPVAMMDSECGRKLWVLGEE